MKKYFLFIFLAAFAKNAIAQPIEGTLLSNWTDRTILANATNGGTFNEIWGFVSNGHEYAVLVARASSPEDFKLFATNRIVKK